jgi:uncharacterized membrane protein
MTSLTLFHALFHALLALGILASALMAGFFYAYSISVMPGLTKAGDPLIATRAMQGINAAVGTPIFAFAFFGALAFPLLAAATALAAYPWQVAALTLAGALAYGLGAFAVTFAFNIPLNNTLASATPKAAEDAAQVWRSYVGPWLAWNHLRTVSSILALVLLTAALVAALDR